MGGGGAERVVANLANCLANEYEVLIYTPTDNNSFYYLDKKVRIEGAGYKVSKKKIIRPILLGINVFKLYFNFYKKMKIEKPDVVISFLTETNIVALLQARRKYKLIISERNDPYRYNALIQIIIKKLYKKADAFVCQSQTVKQYFEFSNCIVIENPIDTSKLETVYKGERKKEIVAVGRLMPQKNFALLIEAFSKLKKEYSDYILKIYGEGILREELQKQIDNLNLNERVFLVGASQNVTRDYREASLFVMSSDYEGFPNALIEAMAMGLPVISTDFATGVAREFIQENNGILVPVGDVNALTKSIETLLANKAKRELMSENNIKMREKFSINIIENKWKKLIED